MNVVFEINLACENNDCISCSFMFILRSTESVLLSQGTSSVGVYRYWQNCVPDKTSYIAKLIESFITLLLANLFLSSSQILNCLYAYE